jgi:hypothetical protein
MKTPQEKFDESLMLSKKYNEGFADGTEDIQLVGLASAVKELRAMERMIPYDNDAYIHYVTGYHRACWATIEATGLLG